MLTLEQHLSPWWQLPVAVIDFETTGVDPCECSPVEIAIVRFERGEVVGRWSTLINIGDVPIPEEASRIHGITADMLADAPNVGMLTSVVEVQAGELLRGAVPCGYNGQSYDRIIFHRYVYHSDGALVHRRDCPWLDPLIVVRDVDKYEPGSGRHKLTAACARRGITIEGAHRAMADAEACGRLLFALQDRIGNATISELLRRQSNRAAAQDKERAGWLAKQPPRESATP